MVVVGSQHRAFCAQSPNRDEGVATQGGGLAREAPVKAMGSWHEVKEQQLGGVRRNPRLPGPIRVLDRL